MRSSTSGLLATLVLLGLYAAVGATRTPRDYGSFPYCKCVRRKDSPFKISVVSEEHTDKGIRFCFDITAEKKSGACGYFDLKKVTIDMDPKCQKVRDATFNNAPIYGENSEFGVGKAYFKVTGGNKIISTFEAMEVKPARLCFTAPSHCPLEVFCKGKECKAAFFDLKKECCPITTTHKPSPPPCPSNPPPPCHPANPPPCHPNSPPPPAHPANPPPCHPNSPPPPCHPDAPNSPPPPAHPANPPSPPPPCQPAHPPSPCTPASPNTPPPPKCPDAPAYPNPPSPASPNTPPPPQSPDAPAYPNPPSPCAPGSPNTPPPPKCPDAPAYPNPPSPCSPGSPNSPPPPCNPSYPPPPPPVGVPPPGFPYCNCDKRVPSAYSMKYQGVNAYGKDVQMCFTLNTQYVESRSPCANQDLRKIEVEIVDSMRGAIRSIQVGEHSMAPSFASHYDKQGKHTVLKIGRAHSADNLLGTFSQLQGKQVKLCLTLTSSAVAKSGLSSLCKDGQCAFAFFSSSLKCCPVSTLAAY